MPKFRVSASVVGSKYLGEFEAKDEEEAVELALKESGSVCLCHHCADEIIDPEIDPAGCSATLIENE